MSLKWTLNLKKIKNKQLLEKLSDQEQQNWCLTETLKELQSNTLVHSVFTCNECQYQSNTLDNLNKHMQETKHSQSIVKDFICEHCDTEHESGKSQD